MPFGGSVTVKGALETPPPGAGFVTLTVSVPAVATSEAKICTCNCVELTNVVARALPLIVACELEMNAGEFDPEAAGAPLMVRIPPTGNVPAAVLAGESELIDGAGFAG